MKIKDLELVRYGIYRNLSWHPATDRLVVVMGENESGKTTMLRFIRDMLFGYPRGEWRGREGNMGLSRANGEDWRVYRVEKESRLETAAGEVSHEDMSSAWWHGLDRRMYEKMFAVGLEDLQGAGFLAEDEVRSRFFLLSGGDSLAEARRGFLKQKEALLSPSTSGKRRINQLLEKKRELDVTLETLSADEERFSKLQKEQIEIRDKIAEAEKTLRADKEEERALEKRLGAWQYYERAREIRRRLDLSEQVKHFPKNGKEQWNQLMSRMALLHEQKEQLDEKLAEHTPQTMEEVIPWVHETETLEGLYRDLGRWQEAIDEETALTAEMAAWREGFAGLSAQLTLWTEPLSPDETYAAIDWEEGRRVAQGVSVRQNEYHFWAKREPEVEEEEVAPEDIPKATEEDWRNIEEKAARAETLVRERNARKAAYQALSEKKDSYFTIWFVAAFLLMLGAGAALYGFYAAMVGVDGLYGAGIAAALSIVFLFVNHVVAGKKAKQMARLSAELSAIEGEIADIAAVVPVPIPDAEEELSVFRNAMQQKRGEFYKALSAAQALSWKHESIERQRREHEKWEEEGKTLAEAKAEAEAEWNQWLSSKGLPSVSADHLETLRDEWQTIFAAKGAGNILTVRMERLRARLSEFEGRAKKIIGDVPEIPLTPETISEIYKENTKRQLEWQTVSEKNRQHEGYEQELESNRRQWDACQDAMKLLLESVGAATAEEFAERVTAYEEHDSLQRDWETVQKDIRLYAGSDEEFAKLWALLGTGEYDEWKEKHDALSAKIEEEDGALAEMRTRQGAVENEIARLANDEAITKVLQEKNQTESDLAKAAEAWLTDVYAVYFLEKAQQQYESGERPKILARANEFLRKMTQGRYGLEVSADGKKISTVDALYDKKDAKIWSSGTGDQVYLALRLSMALSFGEQLEALPIVLDDIFVRFDEERQRETLRFLMELGRQTQIFLFTCHAQTLKLAQEVGAEQNTGEFWKLTSGSLAPVGSVVGSM